MLLEQSSHTTITNDASPVRVVSTLQIVNVQWPADHGFYICRGLANNFTEITFVEATAHLHVQGTYVYVACLADVILPTNTHYNPNAI